MGKRKLTNREYFSSYLTGIFEASGCIYIYKNKYPHIYISFHKNNLVLAEAIKERIGHGAIYEKYKNISYEIFNKEGILKFIEITKDYLRTPKIHEYNKMLEYLNANKKCSFSLVELDSNPFDYNAWLSGFLESNGSFSIYTNYKRESWFYFTTSFKLKLKKKDKENNSYEPFMLSLANFFTATLEEKLVFESLLNLIDLYKLSKIKILNDYLKEFPLFGVQGMNHKLFESIHLHRINPVWKFDKEKFNSGGLFPQLVEKTKAELNIDRPNYKAEYLNLLPRLNDEEISF